MSVNDSTTKSVTIYFIQVGDDGPIKIGLTDKPIASRLAGLQTSCPYPLNLLASMSGCGGGVERTLHERFSHLRLRGEWFEAKPELLDYITSVAADRPAPLSDLPFTRVMAGGKLPVPSTPKEVATVFSRRKPWTTIQRRELTRCPVSALEYRAIRDLLKAGWTAEEIALDRNFSLRTCKRRIKKLEQLEAMLTRKSIRPDDD